MVVEGGECGGKLKEVGERLDSCTNDKKHMKRKAEEEGQEIPTEEEINKSNINSDFKPLSLKAIPKISFQENRYCVCVV